MIIDEHYLSIIRISPMKYYSSCVLLICCALFVHLPASGSVTVAEKCISQHLYLHLHCSMLETIHEMLNRRLEQCVTFFSTVITLAVFAHLYKNNNEELIKKRCLFSYL